MIKNNRQSLWSIPFMLLFALIAHFLTSGRIHSGFWTFLIIFGILSSVLLFWDNRYFTSLEETLHTFSNTYNGAVELIKVTERSEIVSYDARGNYYNRAFHIDTERAIKRMGLKGNLQMMNVRLKIDSPVIASLKLKRSRWGKVDLDPLTIADVYDIQFTIQQQMPTVVALYDDYSERFRDEFVNLVDQQKLGVKLSRLGKKYRDYLSRFHICTDGENIRVHKCQMIRSVDDLENLMDSLKEMAKIIEDLSNRRI